MATTTGVNYGPGSRRIDYGKKKPQVAQPAPAPARAPAAPQGPGQRPTGGSGPIAKPPEQAPAQREFPQLPAADPVASAISQRLGMARGPMTMDYGGGGVQPNQRGVVPDEMLRGGGGGILQGRDMMGSLTPEMRGMLPQGGPPLKGIQVGGQPGGGNRQLPGAFDPTQRRVVSPETPQPLPSAGGVDPYVQRMAQQLGITPQNPGGNQQMPGVQGRGVPWQDMPPQPGRPMQFRDQVGRVGGGPPGPTTDPRLGGMPPGMPQPQRPGGSGPFAPPGGMPQRPMGPQQGPAPPFASPQQPQPQFSPASPMAQVPPDLMQQGRGFPMQQQQQGNLMQSLYGGGMGGFGGGSQMSPQLMAVLQQLRGGMGR